MAAVATEVAASREECESKVSSLHESKRQLEAKVADFGTATFFNVDEAVHQGVDALSMVSVSPVDRILGQGSPWHERIAFVRRGWSAHTILRPPNSDVARRAIA